MLENISYWAFFGTFYLIILTWQDFKDKMLVDDRFNFFMLGMTLSLISHVKRAWWIILGTLVILYVMYYFMNKYNLLGNADIKTIGWQFYGFAILNLSLLVGFSVILAIIGGIYLLLKHIVFKYNNPTPFYPVLLISFVVSCILFQLY